MPRNILHNEYPKNPIAQYSSLGDRAIVETPDGKVYTYDVTRPEGQRFVEETDVGLHPGMWLPRGFGIQIAIRPAGEYPFTELEREIELQARCHTAHRCLMMSLDPTVDAKNRTLMAGEATKLIEEVAVHTVIHRVMMGTPLPAFAVVEHGPTEGKAGALLKAVVAKWRPNDAAEYAVSFRYRKSIEDLADGEGRELADYLRAIGLNVTEVLEAGTVIVLATTHTLESLRDSVGAVCNFVERTRGRANAS